MVDVEEALFLGDDLELTLDEHRALALFDEAQEFKRGGFANALRLTEQAIPLSPEDTVLHEFYATVLFSLRRYDAAAIVLNSLLAVTPGMDWETMSRLYENDATYTTHLRLLENHVGSSPSDAAALFVLAYHYLMLGETAAATNALQEVVALKPDDRVASQLLMDLTGDGEPLPAPRPIEAKKAPSVIEFAKPEVASEDEGVEDEATDLAGNWRSDAATQQVDLTIDESGTFEWRLQQAEQPPRVIAGSFELAGEILVLDGGEQGTIVGRVTPGGPSQFGFKLVNGSDEDPGMTFKRK